LIRENWSETLTSVRELLGSTSEDGTSATASGRRAPLEAPVR
jgi:hypothetical protein